MPLREGHRAGVEPHIDKFGNPAHFAAATTLQCDGINVGPVEIERFRKYRSFPPQFINPANRSFGLAVPANPDRKRRPPISIPRDGPVFVFLKPVAETSL